VSAVMVDKQDDAEDFRQAYLKAVKLLVTREHSRMEIELKLTKRDVPAHFASVLADQRLRKGFGPQSIQAKLQERGIDRAIITETLDDLDTDWVAQAVEVIRRRFNPAELADTSQRQRGKVARFLQSRGFSPSVSHRALDNCLHEEFDGT